MGVPVAYLQMTQRFPLTQDQVDLIKKVESGGLVALRFLFRPTPEQFSALGATIDAAIPDWNAEVKVSHE